MKVIKSSDGYIAYKKLFYDLLGQAAEVVVWQVSRIDGQRTIHYTVLTSFRMENNSLHFIDKEGKKFDFESDILFFYAEQGQAIFKAHAKPHDGGGLSVDMPQELQLLEEPDIHVIKGVTGVDMSDVWKVKRLVTEHEAESDLMKVRPTRSARDKEILDQEMGPVSLDEEDKMFAGKRESPRARPKIDKTIRLRLATETGDGIVYRLFDLSRGGMGFLTLDGQAFKRGDVIHVMGFDLNILDTPLVGDVMSVRPVDGSEVEFKVGVKFVDDVQK